MPKKSKVYPVVVVWLDADFRGGAPRRLEEIRNLNMGILTESCGWLVRNDHAGVAIATDRCEDSDYVYVHEVPWPYVKSCYRLDTGSKIRRPRKKLPKKKKKK